VLVLVGELPPGLKRAAAVAYEEGKVDTKQFREAIEEVGYTLGS